MHQKNFFGATRKKFKKFFEANKILITLMEVIEERGNSLKPNFEMEFVDPEPRA